MKISFPSIMTRPSAAASTASTPSVVAFGNTNSGLTLDEARERKATLVPLLGNRWNGLGITKVDGKFALKVNHETQAAQQETIAELLENQVIKATQPRKANVYQYGDIQVQFEVVGPIVAL